MNQVRSGSRRKEIVKYLMWYTILFGVTAGGIFIWFFLENKSFCWTTDAVSQYVPKAYYFIRKTWETITGILKGTGGLSTYDFQLGMGTSIPLHMEPLYWIYLFFPPKYIETAFGCVLFLRFYIAGLSMSAFLFYFKNGKWESLTASLLYVFSGYGLFAGLRHSHFLVPMITLPLMLIGMEEICRKKRWYICTIMTAISLWCGYYFTYMNTLIMGVYFLIRVFERKENRSIRAFLLRVRTAALSYILGVVIANITLIVNFSDYLTSSRTQSVVENMSSLWEYGSNWFFRCAEYFLVTSYSPGKWLRLGFTALSYFAVILIFIKKGRRSLKISFITGTVFCCVPLFAYVFSGFSSITNRWCYAYAFVIAVMTAYGLRDIFELSFKKRVLLLIGMIPYLMIAATVYSKKMDAAKTVMTAAALLLIVYICIVFLNLQRNMKLRWKKGVVTVMSVLLLWVSGMMQYSPSFGNMVSEFTGRGKVLGTITDTPLKSVPDMEEGEFFRSASRVDDYSVQNAAMILGYAGITYYSSTPSKAMVDYYRSMGLTSWNIGRLCGFDERTFPDTLASVKYYAAEEGKTGDIPYGYVKEKETEIDGKRYEIYRNRLFLPLGYAYDRVISQEELESYDTESRQEVVLQAAVVDEEALTPFAEEEKEEPVTITGRNRKIIRIEGDGVEVGSDFFRVTEAGGTVRISFEGMDNSETYLSIAGMSRNSSGRLNIQIHSGNTDTSYYYYGDKSIYNTGQSEYVFNLGYSEEAKTECEIRFADKCKISFDEISVYCQPMEYMDGYVEHLRESTLENISMTDNRITGEISLDRPKLLVLSIPYENGWTAYVDGEKQTIERVNLMYSGIMLEPGDHEIELRFQIPGLKLSILISAAGICIFVAALMIRRKRKNAL